MNSGNCRNTENSRIGIGVVGLGGNGQFAMQSFREDEYLREHTYLVAAADPKPEIARTAGEEFGVTVYRIADDLFARNDIKLVKISSPHDTHSELAIAALQAGKCVLCEKPLAITRDQCDAVEQQVRKGGFFEANFELRHSLMYERVNEIISSGEIGDVTSFYFMQRKPPMTGGTWHTDIKRTGGAFHTELCHFIDLFRWWSQDEVRTIHAYSPATGFKHYGQETDTTFATIVFEKGAIAQLNRFVGPVSAKTASTEPHQAPLYQHRVELAVTGTKGALSIQTVGWGQDSFCIYCYRYEDYETSSGEVRTRNQLVRREAFDGSSYFCYRRLVHDQRTLFRRVVDRIRYDKVPMRSIDDVMATTRACCVGQEKLQKDTCY